MHQAIARISTGKELTINSDTVAIKPSIITDITSVVSSIECSKICNSDHTGVGIINYVT